ncbi:MAG TPA: serine/threonine-protein kinase, partial [Ktedonobacteraceae bacterium]|nr:serine/threonine-protein kinase [Ktedonobacteraceae bacterium]
MSIVFLAQRLDNPQDQAAIKILLPSDFSTAREFAAFRARFLREAQIVHQLHHEHILPVLDSGEEDDGIFYMIMPLISGGTLAHKLALASGPLPLHEIASYLDQLASAIDYSNQHGMVHRDIKPSNVLIDEQGNVYLADFGIVRLFASDHLTIDEAPTTLTTTGKIYGTPAYMAPERFRGEQAEPATDIYALGILLYQLVTGQLPFDADNPLALGMKHLNEEPLSPRSLRPDLPEPAEVAIFKAIAKRPAERFTSASALATAFSTGLKGEWVEELLPLAAVIAVSSIETLVEQPAADPIAPVANDVRPDQLFLAPAPEVVRNDNPLAFATTATNAPVIARSEPRFWKNLQLLALGALGVVLLLSAGLLALAVYKLGIPTPTPPGIHTISTSTSTLPAKTTVTPISSAGTAPTAKSTPTSAPTSGSTPAPA